MAKLVEAVRLAASIKKAGPKKFTQHMVPHVVRPAQIIWNKALGAVFLLMACAMVGYSVNYYRMANPVGVAMTAFFGAVMLFFGVDSFRRARRLARLQMTRL